MNEVLIKNLAVIYDINYNNQSRHVYFSWFPGSWIEKNQILIEYIKISMIKTQVLVWLN